MEQTKTRCPHCGSEKVSKNAHNKEGKQRYNCKNKECTKRTFIEKYDKKSFSISYYNI